MKENEQEEKKSKKDKFLLFFRKRAIRVGAIYTALFALSAAGAYWATPLLNGSLDSENSIDKNDVDGLSNVDRFMAALTDMSGMQASINELSVTFPDNDGIDNTTNVVSLAAGSKLLLSMPDTKHIGFHLDTTVTLSTPNSGIADVSKAMLVNYDGSDLYVSVLGAKYKYLSSTYEQIIDDFISVMGKDAVTIDPSFYSWVEGLIGGMSGDISSTSDISVSFVETASTSSSYSYTCTITYGGSDYAIDMTSDTSYNLTSVKASLTFGDVALKFDITTDMKTPTLSAISSYAPSDKDDYVSIVNMNGVFRKVANLVKAKKFDVNFEGALTYKWGNEEDKKDDSVSLNALAKINLADKDYRVGLNIKDAISDTRSKNVQIAYLPADGNNPQEAFLNYNGIYKASMDQLTLDALMGRVSNAFDGSSSSFDASKAKNLFSFVFDSDVMKAIGEGHYQQVIESIDDLKTSDDKIVAGINLKGYGFGDNSKISVTIDGNGQEGVNNIKLLRIELSGISFKDYAFNGVITLDEYEEEAFVRSGFNRLEKLPDVYDQISGIANDKKAAFTLDADISIKDSADISLKGNMQFDANKNLGTGKIKVVEPSKSHLLTADFNSADVRLQYQDADTPAKKGTLAKISVSSVTDFVDFVSSLSSNERFTNRFVSPFSSVVGEIAISSTIEEIAAGRYGALASLDILKGYTFTDTQSVFTINAVDLGYDQDLSFAINYASEASADEEGGIKHSVSSFQLLPTEFGQVTVGATLAFGQYDEENTANLSYEESEYNDFSHVSSLAKAAINTAVDYDTYHITAAADVTLWTANIIHIDLDFVAQYTDNGWEYYAKLSNIPLIPAVNSQYSIFLGYRRNVEIVYKNGKVYLRGENPFGEHGYDTEQDRTDGKKIDWSESNAGTFSKEYLSSTENLLKFILGDILNVQPYYLDMIASSDSQMSLGGLSFDMPKLAYEDVLESTSYDAETNDYGMTLNVGAMFQTDYVIKASFGTKVNNDEHLTQLVFNAFVFAGVRVDFSFSAELIEVGDPLSETMSQTIANVIALAEAGTAH